MSAPVTIVAGSGQSLARIAPGRILARDRIVRVNNFFFEDRFYLGPRVDLAFVAGDPRIVPFVAETLTRAAAQYRIAGWSAASDRVARAARRHLSALPFQPLTLAPAARAELDRLQSLYQAKASSGVLALLHAHGRGARALILAGFDLYEGAQRYVYTPGRHQRDLLGQDLGRRSWDLHLHHPDLDRALIGWLADAPDVALWRSADGALQDLLDLAPERPGPAPDTGPKARIDDWADWAGWYPIGLLKLMRRARALQRRLTGDVPK